MTNLLDVVGSLTKTLLQMEEKKPIHIGEAMGIWTYLAMIQEFIVHEEIALNTTEDEEVMKVLNDAKNLCQSQTRKLDEFMNAEGIPFPPSVTKKPESNPQDIPVGVKMTDREITNWLAFKISTAIKECANIQSISIRNDVVLIFIEFQSEMLTYGAKLKLLMQKKDWLKVPPIYLPPGTPAQ